MKVILKVKAMEPGRDGDLERVKPYKYVKEIFEKIFRSDEIWGLINDISINEYGFSIDVTSVNVSE